MSTERWNEWKQKNPERHRARIREWCKRNPDKVREYQRRYRKRHPERIRETRRRANEKDRERRCAFMRARKQACRRLLNTIKRLQGCALCTEREPFCLAFHHVDPSSKSFTIGSETRSIMTRPTWERLLREMEKCLVLCHNCHAKVEYCNLSLPENVSRLPRDTLKDLYRQFLIRYRDVR